MADLYFVAGPSATSGNNAYVITVNTTQVAKSLTFQTSGATTISGGTSITLGNGTPGVGGITMNQFAYGSTAQGAVTISTTPVILNNAQNWTNNAAAALTVRGGLNLNGNALTFNGTGIVDFSGTANIISGAGGLTVSSGRVTLGGGGTTPAHTYSGDTNINGGSVVMFNGNTGNLSANSNININGGIFESYWTGGLTRVLGSGANQLRITGGESGFSMNGSNGATFNLGTSVTWGSTNFAPSKFLLQSDFSQNNSVLTFSTAINLNGATRTIVVNDGVSDTARADISGAISNSTGTAGLIKEGAGRLLLTNNTSAWNGNTTVSAGLLSMGGINLANIGGGSGRNITVANGASIQFNALSNAVLNRIVETTDEIGVMSGGTANNFDFSSSTGANLPNAFLGNYATNGAKAEMSGTITQGSNGYKLGARYSNGLLGIVGSNKLTGTSGLTVGQTGSSGIRVELAAANDFSGNTVINSGSKLTIGNNLALQNSALNLGSAGGTFALHAAFVSGHITGATASPSPTFGGLIGSRNLSAAFTSTGGNNEQLLANTAVTGFTLNPGTGKSHLYSGVIANFAVDTTLTKTGDGTQELAAANAYTGGTTISGGTLKIGNATTLGTGGRAVVSTGETIVGSGAVLDLNGVSGVNEQITLSGDGIGGNGALVNNSASPASIGSGVASLQMPSATTGSANSPASAVITITGTGTGATATATLGLTNASFVVNVSGDRNYTVAPTIAITGGGGTGATATPILSGGTTGTVTGLTITSPGVGYVSNPTATVSGGTSTGATTTTFTGNATNSTVVGLNLTAAGSGYTGTPTYSYAGGDAVPGSVIISSVVLAADSGIGGSGDMSIAAAVSESGGSRSLTKVGAGTLTLSGVNTYSGNTTASGGTLSLGADNTSNNLSTVTIGTSGILQLTYAGTDNVDKLFIGATQQPAGVYGHSSTGADNGGQGVGVLDARFASGSGTLTVATGPGGGPTGFAAWQAANSTAGAIDADHDGDGVDNGTEYFLGGTANTTGFTALPGVTNTGGTLSVTWTKAATYGGTYGGTGFVVQTSDTLTGWSTAATSGSPNVADTVYISGNSVTYTFPAGTKNFARLKVTGP